MDTDYNNLMVIELRALARECRQRIQNAGSGATLRFRPHFKINLPINCIIEMHIHKPHVHDR